MTKYYLLLLFFSQYSFAQLMNGVNMIPAWDPVDKNCMQSVQELNAKWVSLVIYQYGDYQEAYLPQLGYESRDQKWGESLEGIEKMVSYAHEYDLKVMLKPSVWFPNHGWPGDFELATKEEWEQWETLYQTYILSYAKLAEKTGVELICIGTEMKRAIQIRPQYWKKLIEEIRQIYSGKLTYAANWDNVFNIPFWKDLDYIGVDAYYPLSQDENPCMDELLDAWKEPKKQLKQLYKKCDKPIIFTEYGYRSVDKAMWRQWEIENLYDFPANHEAQKVGYEAIFQTFWEEDWFAGGFIWKWSPHDSVAGGPNNNDYTPQNKPCEAMIRKHFEEQKE